MEKQVTAMSDAVRQAVFYQIFLRSFTPEGTLSGARKKLSRIAELGVTHVYLCPVVEADDHENRAFWSRRQRESGMENPKNPYRLKDYVFVDPEYGTDRDLKDFVEEAHRLGMGVLLDLVYLHCGPGAHILSEHPDFVRRDEAGQLLLNEYNFASFCHEKPAVRQYFKENMAYFVREFGVDGYRCDAAEHVPLDFWEECCGYLQELKPDIIFLSEGVEPKHLRRAFHLTYSFFSQERIIAAISGKGRADEIRAEWQERTALYPEEGRCIRYLESHDLASDCYEQRYDKVLSAEAVEAGFALIYTLDGVPMLYGGNEICDCGRHSLWSNRDFGGLCVDWSLAESEKAKSRSRLLTRLAKLRRQHRALHAGKLLWQDNEAPEKVLSFYRETEGERLFVAVNLSGEGAKITAPQGECLFSRDGQMEEGILSLEGYGFGIYRV